MIDPLPARFADMKAHALKNALALNNATQSLWHKFAEDPELQERPAMELQFDREQCASEYKKAVDAYDKAYTSRDAQAAKLQSDMLSSMQQGYLLRYYFSRLDMMGHSLSRLKSQGQYTIEQVHERYITNLESAE